MVTTRTTALVDHWLTSRPVAAGWSARSALYEDLKSFLAPHLAPSRRSVYRYLRILGHGERYRNGSWELNLALEGPCDPGRTFPPTQNDLQQLDSSGERPIWPIGSGRSEWTPLRLARAQNMRAWRTAWSKCDPRQKQHLESLALTLRARAWTEEAIGSVIHEAVNRMRPWRMNDAALKRCLLKTWKRLRRGNEFRR